MKGGPGGRREFPNTGKAETMQPSQVKEAVHVEQRGFDTRVVISITPGGAGGRQEQVGG